jgi:hypothetical protein
MTIQSAHFSIVRLIQRFWALGLEPRRSTAQSAGSAMAVRQNLAVFIDFENVSNDVAIRSVFEILAPCWNPIWRRAYGSRLGTHLRLFR